MIQEIATALATLKTATEIAKGLSTIRIDVEIKTKTSELIGIIIDLQGTMLALQAKLSDLQSENTNLKQKLLTHTDLATAAGELEFRDNVYWKQGDQIPFCPTCWEDKKKRIHLDGSDGTERLGNSICWYCTVCQNEVYPRTTRW